MADEYKGLRPFDALMKFLCGNHKRAYRLEQEVLPALRAGGLFPEDSPRDRHLRYIRIAAHMHAKKSEIGYDAVTSTVWLLDEDPSPLIA